MNKQDVLEQTEQEIEKKGFTIIDKDWERPWGGFFVIDEQEAPRFAETFFQNLPQQELNKEGKLSPKILVVEPDKRLSWQYHHRRAEVWQVVEGPVGVMKSDTDEEQEVDVYESGETVTLKQGERHRLVGLQKWGIIAEIWQHTDPDHPSDEEDIIRLQDDFGR